MDSCCSQHHRHECSDLEREVFEFPSQEFDLNGETHKMKNLVTSLKGFRWVMGGRTVAYSYSLIPVFGHKRNGEWIIETSAACIFSAPFVDDKSDGIFWDSTSRIYRGLDSSLGKENTELVSTPSVCPLTFVLLPASGSPWWMFPQFVRALKFFRQLPRSQIFADMRQPLLYFPQSVFKILPVADCDVPPHRVGTRRDTRHLL